MLSRRLIITGDVQGVGYRYAMHDEAKALGVRGWVRNRHDGSVEAELHGENAAVEALVAWAQRGPRAARVSAVRAEACDAPLISPERFEILPSA
jgi:acylphosphatase